MAWICESDLMLPNNQVEYKYITHLSKIFVPVLEYSLKTL